jgi:hypothetical protein
MWIPLRLVGPCHCWRSCRVYEQRTLRPVTARHADLSGLEVEIDLESTSRVILRSPARVTYDASIRILTQLSRSACVAFRHGSSPHQILCYVIYRATDSYLSYSYHTAYPPAFSAVHCHRARKTSQPASPQDAVQGVAVSGHTAAGSFRFRRRHGSAIEPQTRQHHRVDLLLIPLDWLVRCSAMSLPSSALIT